MPSSSFAADLSSRLPSLSQLHGSSPRKYQDLRTWLADQFAVDFERVATVYLSDLSKEFTARVGASLISEPLVLVVLGSGDFERPNDQSISPLDRLARVCAYVGRIELVIVATVDETSGSWNVPFVVGPLTSKLFETAQTMLPKADAVPVVVPPL